MSITNSHVEMKGIVNQRSILDNNLLFKIELVSTRKVQPILFFFCLTLFSSRTGGRNLPIGPHTGIASTKFGDANENGP